MAGKPRNGKGHSLTEGELNETKAAWLVHGNVNATARALGISRRATQNRLDKAASAGLMDPARSEANVARWRPFEQIVAARKAEFARVKAAGDGRTLNTLPLADDGPFCLVALGDPHLDAPGCDLTLWEMWNDILDGDAHVHGLCLGDWLDNWVGKLQFLYGASETPAPEAWIMLIGYLDLYAQHYLASCSGNHDDWSGYTDLLGHLMTTRGVLHRQNSIRVSLVAPGGRTITVGMRHRFAGNSQWNPAHAVMKAAQMGWRDTMLIGGDKHVSGDGLVKCPDSGKLTWCYQVAAFKLVDDYGDKLGLADKHVSPAVAFVVDPARDDDDPQLVTAFHDAKAAVAYLAHLRARP